MFGSKLRSWMETHIVRPRKKNNKHKQQAEQAAAGAGGSSSSHGKKAGTLPAARDNLKSTTSPVLTSSGSHSIASPVRRREVSPIQCHTPSRYGWQSPDQETITSPKSDNLLYAPHRYQRHQTLPPLQTPPPPQQHLLSCSTDKSPLRVNCSSSSISSLSWSTGSKEPSSAAAKVSSSYTKVEHIETSCEYRAPVEDEVDYEEVGMLLVRPPAPMQDYQLVYEPELEPEPEPEQARQSASNHVHYGRLLPSKLAEPVVANQGLSNQGNLGMGAGNRGMRPARGLPQRGNFLPGPRPHSLSSPESAYSTGYSTDGTSPCAVVASSNPPQAAAPEYYINMRSGTHYFPSRSVNSLAIEAQRYKFGLNRIEEMSPMDPLPKSNFGHTLEPSPSPLAMQRSVSGAAKLFESPSPRQRSRIRTNPWYNTLLPGSRMELDATSTTSTTSSGIKSGNELEVHGGMSTTIAVTPAGGAECSEASSSSTEVENLPAPHTMRRRHEERHEEPAQQQAQQSQQTQLISDDEATLNEMIGKFDESYIYEKETDILSSSDSDATNCNSELDTGQDAGDECDTDELLDIDFIDTSSMHEVMLEQRNLGSCQYYPNPSPMILRRASTRASTRSSTRRRCAQQQEQVTALPVTAPDSGQRRRKRFLKTRKKSCENREKISASPLREPRGSRSVGGTPVCLRRQLLGPKERIYKTSPLSNRSNSLIFGSVQEPQFMTIAESEKALLKADLEADMKYKQLIMEAESLLESLKNSLQSIPRDTPVASPRRLNPLANKRVEMLKHGATVESNKKPPAPPPPAPPLEHELAAAINKRIELLKFETSASPPNSPNPGRCCSPRKTHLTNFMNQNAPPDLPPRKQPPTAAPPPLKAPLSPQLQLNGRRLPGSPRSPRRCLPIGSDSELEEQAAQQQLQPQPAPQLLQPGGNQDFYCPHSEPLKRKVYKGSSSFERIKKTFDLELAQSLLSCSTDKSPLRVNCSSSSISSLSWSTGSKEPSSAAAKVSSSYTKVEHIETSCEYRAPVEDEVDYEEVGMLLVRPPAPMQDYQLVYEPELEPEPEPEQARQSASNHVHYGRLLPSKLAEPVVANQGLSNQGNLGMGAGNRGMRPARGLPQRGNFLPGPRPHSLSSPESAYSTGYSTDGTSPCAVVASSNPPQAAAPEYYINMRSGTHYFPSRSVNSLAIEAQRYKFGLNRIEEMSPMDPLPKSNFGHTLEPSPSPLAMQRSVSGAAKLFESPSPRQRSRIRTNPWYNTLLPGSRMELDATSTTSTTSSGIKSGNELEVHGGMSTTIAVTPAGGAECSEASSSSTEVENLPAPHTMRRRHEERHEEPAQQQAQQSQQTQLISDDEATLNEMIGKFDESYIYEKETDILSSSDSDATNCNSELDTGQDAGDECDTDELLDIDFIDTSSMHEVMLEQRNLGSCQYYPNPSPMILRRASTRASTRSSTRRRCAQQQEQVTALPVTAPDSGQRRRKRFLKTRKKSCENREKISASPLREPRGSRSVGGTPVCLRRQLLGPKERIYKTSPLSNRSNSLIFGSVQEPQFMTIAESEKALLKADLEADMKYKQLIMEAESLLESLKNSLQSIPRDTPVASPRRLNPLANKRVEMLKHGATVESNKKPPAPPPPAPPLEHELAAAINKRIELLKFETSASPPNSPNPGRCCSPRKTHLTNFMNQNAPPDLPPRKQPPTAAPPPLKAPLSPQLQLNGRRLPGSPRSPRRCLPIGSDSELEEQAAQQQLQPQPAPQLLQPGGNQDFYCPHSEPLKRKVYKGSSSFERIKKTFDLELDMNERPKSIGNCNNGAGGSGKRQQSKLVSSVSAKSSMQDVTLEGASSAKQQLIVSTIVDLKRSLEHQSYELCGLTEE